MHQPLRRPRPQPREDFPHSDGLAAASDDPAADQERGSDRGKEDERTHEAEVLRERGVRTRVVGAGAGADRSVREAYDESLETFWRNQGFTTAQIERLKEAK